MAADRSVGFANEPQLTAAAHDAFVGYWHSGARDFPSALDQIVDYWMRYHVAKAVIAAILFVVLATVGVRVWRSFLAAGSPGRRVALASTIITTMLGLLSLTVVMVNVRGAVVPFASVLPMLIGGESGGPLASALDEIRQQLSVGAHESPAIDVMVSDFARYHAVMAGIAGAVGVGLVVTSVVFWRKLARSTDRRTKPVLGSFGAIALLCTLSMIVVAVANTMTAADPVPALLALLEGGW